MPKSSLTLLELTERVVAELRDIENTQRPSNETERPELPRLIDAGTGDGRCLIVNKAIDEVIEVIALQLKANDARLATHYTHAEFAAMVRAAFGPALMAIDLEDDIGKNSRTVLAQVQNRVRDHASTQADREFAFGCTLFSRVDHIDFKIGPVRFESRDAWLERKLSENAISKVMRDQLRAKWVGAAAELEEKPRESLHVANILEAVGSSPIICSVSTSSLAPDAGHEKSLTAARLALTAIALLWRTPSKALDGMNLAFDGSYNRKHMLSFAADNSIMSGISRNRLPHGPSISEAEWQSILERRREFFFLMGEILKYVVTPGDSPPRAALLNTLAQALIWFHEGCRESVPLMSIVKFSATLDALACGGKSGGICRLINARLEMSDDQPIRKDGPTVREAITEIYSDGRSRTIHGTNEKLGHDWTPTRGLAEQFSKLCLLSCIKWAWENPGNSDPREMSVP